MPSVTSESRPNFRVFLLLAVVSFVLALLYTPAPVSAAVRYEDNNLAVFYVGQWGTDLDPSVSGGSHKISRGIASTATLDFYGTGVTWIAAMSNTYGIAKVYVDGVYQQEIDLYSPVWTPQQNVFAKSGLDLKYHSIKIEVPLTKNPASLSFWVSVDAFDVEGVGGDDTQPPSVPSNLTASAIASSQIDLSWSPSTDNVRVTGYKIERSMDGSTGWKQVGTSTTTVYSDLGLDPLTTYYYRVRATDSAGNNSGYSNLASATTAPLPTLRRFEETDPNVTYQGTWTPESDPAVSAGSQKLSNAGGSTAVFSFHGSIIRWIATKSSSYGIARVYLDGVYQQDVDLYSQSRNTQVAVFAKNGMSYSAHSLKIEVAGTKNSSSSGSSVSVDAFETDGTAGKPPPAVGAMAPVSGSTGTEVVISGNNFGFEPGFVTFNGIEAVPVRYEESNPYLYDYYVSWSSYSDGNLSGGSARRSNVGGSVASFLFTDAPVTWISKVGPDSGPAEVYVDGVLQASVNLFSSEYKYKQPVFTYWSYSGGTHVLQIKVVGTRSSSASNSYVTVDAIDVGGGGPYSWSNTEIKVGVPWHATSGTVVVATDGGSDVAGEFLIAEPRLTGLDPVSGQVGTEITLTGSNFGSVQGIGAVSFGGAKAEVASWADTRIAVKVPVGATDGPVAVTTNGGTSNQLYFDVLSSPLVHSISPNSGRNDTTTDVIITGAAFQATPAVKIGSTSCSGVVWESASSLRAKVPAGLQAGTYDVTVTNPDGRNGVLSQAFTVTVPTSSPAPSAPAGGGGGTSVTTTTTVEPLVLVSAISTGGIRGKVVNQAHQPLPLVVVRAGSLATTTDFAGEFFLLNVSPGVLTLYYEADGYHGQTQVIEVVGSTTATPPMVIMSRLTGEIFGKIVDYRGRVIPGARVRIDNTVMPTNASGEFLFTLVHPGVYVLYYSAPGYREQTQVIQAVGGVEIRCPTVIMQKMGKGKVSRRARKGRVTRRGSRRR